MVSNRTLFRERLLLVTFVSVLVSCEMVVDIDLPEEPPQLVVSYVFAVDAPYRSTIALTQSQSTITNTEVQRVAGASITIREEGDCTMLREIRSDCVVAYKDDNHTGFYVPSVSIYPSAGKTYTLNAVQEGFETITATTHIPKPTEILRVDYDTTVVLPPMVSQRSFNVDEVRLTLDDPAEERNYYAVRIQAARRIEKCDSVGTCTLSNNSSSTFYVEMSSDDLAIVSNNYALQGSSIRIYGSNLPFSDELFNGEEYTVAVNPDIFFYGDSLRPYLNVELITMTQEQYDYEYYSWLQQSLQEVPYSQPVLVPGNIEGGFGIFAGYSVDDASIDFR